MVIINNKSNSSGGITMSTVATRKIYHEICSLLLNPNLLKQYGLSKDKVKQYIEGTEFIQQLSHIFSSNDYSCHAVYLLCRNILDELWGVTPPADILYYLYQYTLSKSFPNSAEIDLKAEWTDACEYYLYVLRIFCKYQKKSRDNTLQSKYPLELLTDEEALSYRVSNEYKHFVNIFSREYIYEMMKLNQEVVQHNTLDHICGVHHLALFVGRQLFEAGVPIDLGRVSGAAAGHDLGKFGCRSWESRRVAYLHYYYTDMWFKKHNIPYIGNIALNHSVWDLELENLPIESLVLIYSDFRVKNISDENNHTEMTIVGLKESFDVILNKLDNLDSKKERRYTRVYNKLKDFEEYMLQLGITIDLKIPISLNKEKKKQYYSLMKENEITQHLKYMSIHHNIHLMHKLRDETSLNEILELARSQKDPKILREYLDIFQEYSTYLTQKQKLVTIKFLYEKLVHHEEDIRRHAAELMGNLIAMLDEDYRKEIPDGLMLESAEISSLELLDQYLKLFVTPDHKMIPLHRKWIGYSLQILIKSLFANCKKVQIEDYKSVILKYYDQNILYKLDINVYLLGAIKYIPMSANDPSLEILFDYLDMALNLKDGDLKILSLDTIYRLIDIIKQQPTYVEKICTQYLHKDAKDDTPAENYLKLKISEELSLDTSIQQYFKEIAFQDIENISDIFLSNLKTATNWIIKKVQVQMLSEYFLEHKVNGLYTAMHFCNLLKVSAIENVRNRAGNALVDIIPHLPLEQRNDIAIELLRALEIEGYQFTKYIPSYLGQITVFLKPYELDELIDDLAEKTKQSNIQINSLLLKTVGILISNYPKYKEIFPEGEIINQKRLVKLLGVLINGLVHDDIQIRQISFGVIGKEVFGSRYLTLEDKHSIFQLIGKKILSLLADTQENELLFLTNSAGLNHIYRFISDYSFLRGPIMIQAPSKIAFFPGTFDPFTSGHKEITTAIRSFGFEVFLAVDEFSWSKRTQPNLVRKNIINMSIADEMDIYLYPEDFPTNLANPNDLRRLAENFQDYRPYIVVGSDVIINASAYKEPESEYSIHNFPHIIFERLDRDYPPNHGDLLSEAINEIKAPVIRLNLPPQYEDISSTQIRTYIDENRDISKLIDPMAQKYIYDNNHYRKEPQYKSILQTISMQIEVIEAYDEEVVAYISRTFHQNEAAVTGKLKAILEKPVGSLIVIRDIEDKSNILAYSAFHWVPSDMLYKEFNNSKVTEFIRENYSGRIILIDGIYVNRINTAANLYQIILTETLAHSLKNDFGYCVFENKLDNYNSQELLDTLKLNGYQMLPFNDAKHPTFAVDMTNPITLNLDVETIIKEPFRSNYNVNKCILKTRRRLQEALTKLYPGNLVLSFDRNILDETLVRKICKENEVPPVPLKPRTLGKLMCVPFGNILNRSIVPNTVTKSLHTEKMFFPDMSKFSIAAYPFYLDLPNQIKMIRSFNRSVILVDDLLNKGYRIKALEPLLKEQKVEVKKIIVGILSGRGKELMEIQNLQVDCAYFIPKLRLWFNEHLLYPFIGGDTLWRGINPQQNLLSSINLILPYTSPHFIKGVSSKAIYQLSETAIENAIEILEVLEMEYQKANERKLTLSFMGEVFMYPRCPDHGENMLYDLNMNPSSYLKNDLELLKRMEHSVITGDVRRDENAFLSTRE